MILGKGDYVYVPQLEKYGRIVDIYGREETFYTVTFLWDFVEDADFEESQLVKLEVPDFKVGDIVTGLKGADAYVVTTDKAVMEVLWIKEKSMRVKILNHGTRPGCKGSTYVVNPIWFKLARPRTNFYRDEKED